ncbi:MAG: hypothetical protein GF311_02850 [Candidatus Lokiarchaeota archaeon]|nr:hypothetical protein [Candidatus Lokiarchaeota archaeon]
MKILYRYREGTSIFQEKWDNLIILDACRYDIFEDKYRDREIIGKLSKKISKGAHTVPFLLKNFQKDYYDEFIYITANPQVNIFLNNKFFKTISVWKDHWHKKYNTVLPEVIYEYSIENLIKYPTKKQIIHFMQPHCPYIGYDLGYENFKIFQKQLLKNKVIDIKKKYRDGLFAIYSMDIFAKLELEDHWKMYEKNLDLVIEWVEKLIHKLPGTTIITADHGEAFGEYLHPLIPIRFYGHRESVRIKPLIEVPWLRIENSDKNKGKSNEITEREKIIENIKTLKGKLMEKKGR